MARWRYFPCPNCKAKVLLDKLPDDDRPPASLGLFDRTKCKNCHEELQVPVGELQVVETEDDQA
jgi:hypothetical protein